VDEDVAPRWARWTCLPAAVAGVALSAYLTYVHFTEPTSLSCPATAVVNCTKVTTSEQSMLFGVIPVAVAGLAYFLVMAALVMPWGWRSPSPWPARLRTAGAVAGIGMVWYLVYVEALVVRAICIWCTAVHVVTFILFVAVAAAALLRVPNIES
jgi:uncharacterized membrane protein